MYLLWCCECKSTINVASVSLVNKGNIQPSDCWNRGQFQLSGIKLRQMFNLYFHLQCANSYFLHSGSVGRLWPDTGEHCLREPWLKNLACNFSGTDRYLEPIYFCLRTSQFSRHLKVDENIFFLVPEKDINFLDPCTNFAIGSVKVELYQPASNV